MLIVYGKLELKPVNSSRNRNGCFSNININILIVFVVIDNIKDVSGLITALVLNVLCSHLYFYC